MKQQPRFFTSLSSILLAGVLPVLALLGSAPVHAAVAEKSAAAYIVIDHASGHVLEEFNAAKKLQVASLTKIVTAAVVLDWAHAANQSIDQLATVQRFRPELAHPQGVQWSPGDRATLKDLLYAALLQSDNIAAETLADFVGAALSGGQDRELHQVSFVSQMNALARKLGAVNSRFLNAHGLDSLESKRPYSTAEDMAKISAYAMANPAFVFYVTQKDRRISIQHADGSKQGFQLANTNRLLGHSGIDGLKTGTTKRAGECLIISAAKAPDVRKQGETFFTTPRRLEVVVLGSENRFSEAEDLLRRGWAAHEAWISAGRPETPRPEKRSLFGF
jgi:D-alanyl-D-alanine carboxypeptidase (penicillin-binding protein 5/6)